MKKVLILLFIPVYLWSCSGAGTTMPAAKDSSVAPKVTLPYTASYSSTFVPGKDSDVLTVLNSYKDWETGDMAALKTTLADSTEYIFPSGYDLKGSCDSVIKVFTKYRDSLSGVKLNLVAWTSNHSVDKGDDWVNVWYTETDTYKTGKVDSTNYEDDNMIKNGKIVWASSHQQKMKPIKM